LAETICQAPHGNKAERREVCCKATNRSSRRHYDIIAKRSQANTAFRAPDDSTLISDIVVVAIMDVDAKRGLQRGSRMRPLRVTVNLHYATIGITAIHRNTGSRAKHRKLPRAWLSSRQGESSSFWRAWHPLLRSSSYTLHFLLLLLLFIPSNEHNLVHSCCCCCSAQLITATPDKLNVKRRIWTSSPPCPILSPPRNYKPSINNTTTVTMHFTTQTAPSQDLCLPQLVSTASHTP